MLQLKKGEFFGTHQQILSLSDIIITDTAYTHEKVDWHYHQSPYFTFLLRGKLIEKNKQVTHNCLPGTLLFHNSDDAHYNIKPPGLAQGFHIEVGAGFYDRYGLNPDTVKGSVNLDNPAVKLLIRRIFFETKNQDTFSRLAIDQLLLNVFNLIALSNQPSKASTVPPWVKKVREFLNENDITLISWMSLSKVAEIHPVHLSREFNKYFKTNVGDYIRNIRMENAINLIQNSNYSVTNIAYRCGFSDTSHFIKCFKEAMGTSPLRFKKKIWQR